MTDVNGLRKEAGALTAYQGSADDIKAQFSAFSTNNGSIPDKVDFGQLKLAGYGDAAALAQAYTLAVQTHITHGDSAVNKFLGQTGALSTKAQATAGIYEKQAQAESDAAKGVKTTGN